jgi:hypothetical protein
MLPIPRFVSGGLVVAQNAPIVQFGVRDFGFAITGGCRRTS